MVGIFQATIRRVGNKSLGFVIPVEVIEKYGVKEGDLIYIDVSDTGFSTNYKTKRRMQVG